MSKTVEIDRRMLRRRREVAEGRARSNLSRLGLVLISAALIALGVWLFRSPLFAVQRIDVVGAIPHLVDEIRAQSGIDLGQPLVTVRPGQVEKQLTANPWVLSSRVALSWPDRVVIAVEPRLPVAWIANGVGQWALVGIDGVVLDTASQPGTGMPQVQIDPARQAALLGGLEFAANIDPLLFGERQSKLEGRSYGRSSAAIRSGLGGRSTWPRKLALSTPSSPRISRPVRSSTSSLPPAPRSCHRRVKHDVQVEP